MGPSMQITVDSRPAAKVEAEALVSYVFEPSKQQGSAVEAAVAELDQAAGGALGKLAAAGELTGKVLEFTDSCMAALPTTSFGLFSHPARPFQARLRRPRRGGSADLGGRVSG